MRLLSLCVRYAGSTQSAACCAFGMLRLLATSSLGTYNYLSFVWGGGGEGESPVIKVTLNLVAEIAVVTRRSYQPQLTLMCHHTELTRGPRRQAMQQDVRTAPASVESKRERTQTSALG